MQNSSASHSAAQSEKKRKQGWDPVAGWLCLLSVWERTPALTHNTIRPEGLNQIYTALSGLFWCPKRIYAATWYPEFIVSRVLFQLRIQTESCTLRPGSVLSFLYTVSETQYFCVFNTFLQRFLTLSKCSAIPVCGKARRLFLLMCSELNLTVIRSYTLYKLRSTMVATIVRLCV